MEDNKQYVPVTTPASQDGGSGQGSSGGQGSDGQQKSGTNPAVIWGIVGTLVVLLILIVLAVLLVRADPETTAKVRDVFIIFMALETLVIGAALVILIVQLAILTNLLQNEIKPILDSTSDTVNTLRGTVTFISDNAVQPVIRMNSYVAGVRRFIDLIRPR